MIPLGEYVDGKLKECADRVYETTVPSNATFPYIFYRFASSSTVELREDFILEVNVWGYGKSSVSVEEIAQAVKEKLDGTHHLETGLQTSISLVNRLSPPDPDEKVIRRELRFNCRTYLIN